MPPAAHPALVAASAGAARAGFEARVGVLDGVSVVGTDGLDAALAALDAESVEGLVIDCDALGDRTYDLLSAARERWPGLPMLVLSAEPTRERELAVLAAGGLELLTRDSDAALVLAHQKLRAVQRGGGEEIAPARGPLLFGGSAAMQRVRAALTRVAASRASVLIRGESGTGKELVARALHAEGPLAREPFVKIDCTSLPEALLESELFGYEKGAFTGATSRKLGRVELAHGGTLFLDEIGELSLPIQAKLLRLLQDRELERLGGTRSVAIDVRVLAATHRDLESMVERGQFRQDLFYRLNVVPIWLPPLRARRDDVPELAQHFCREAARRNRRPGARLESGALAVLSAQRWPGNVRQLGNFVERLVVLSEHERIDEAAVRAELERPVQFTTDGRGATTGAGSAGHSPAAPPAPAAAPGRDAHLSQVVREAERVALLRALERSGGNRSDAARVLGVSRSTFYAKLKEHGLA